MGGTLVKNFFGLHKKIDWVKKLVWSKISS